MTLRLVLLLSLLTLCCVERAVAAPSGNLLPNGGLDGPAADQPPPKWEPLVIGVPATFATDTKEKHGGQSSARVSAPAGARSYVRSEPIPVAAGETIHGSAWVRTKDVPEGQGTVIMIAEFSDGVGGNESVEKFNTAKIAESSKAWQKIEGSVKVPAGATELRLRLGFSYSSGTCWWDDVTITAQPLAVRLEVPGNRLSPGDDGVPITIVNRQARGGKAVVLSLGKEIATNHVQLDGAAIQKIVVPIKIPPPGKVNAKVAIGSETSDERQLTIPAPIQLSVPSPTHWCVEDGAVLVEGYVDLATVEAQRRGATLLVSIVNDAGQKRGMWSPAAGEPVGDGITPFQMNAGKLPVGEYKIVAELSPKEGKPLRAERPWHVIERRQAKVTINAGGFPEHDGKPIFPIGIFNGGKFKEQADAGFTVTHAYNAARIFDRERPEDDQPLKWLDSSAENGMKMMLMVPMKAAIKGDWDAIRRRVRVFRNHPALLCWDEEEGFARGDFKPDTLKKLRQVVMEEDPNHPFMVGDARAAVATIPDRKNFFPADDMDMGMWWWYPFPMKQQSANALQGEEAAGAGELVLPTFLTQRSTDKPIWVGVQCYKKGEASRYPTPEEYRVQPYLAVIHGAKGVMWYGGSVTGGLYLKPDEGNWPALQKVVREFSDLSPLWLMPSLEAPTVSDASISACIKRAAGRTVLVAANRSQRAVDVTIESPLIPSGTLTHQFAPLGVLIRDLAK